MSTAAASSESVLGDPHWFLYGFDHQSGMINFTQTSRAALTREPFLDKRWNRAGSRNGQMHLSAVIRRLAEKPSPRNLRFIWHTGYCCSTLLAQALDAPGRNMSLCEPNVLVDVTDAKRAGAFAVHADLARLPDIAFGLLSRPFLEGEAVTVKPTPAVNHLLPEAAALDARHLFLFSDCESFIISIAKLGKPGADYATGMLAALQQNATAPDWTGARLLSLSPFQIAALVWHMQIAELRQSGAGANGRSLDCDALLADPAQTLNALDDFFELGLGIEHVDGVVNGPLFQRNSKRPGEAFDGDRRRREHVAARARFGAELSDAVAWSRENFPDTPHGAPLPDPLATFQKGYS